MRFIPVIMLIILIALLFGCATVPIEGSCYIFQPRETEPSIKETTLICQDPADAAKKTILPASEINNAKRFPNHWIVPSEFVEKKSGL